MANVGKWDRRFYLIAMEVAGWSKDPTAKVGAVLVSPDGRRVAWGYNGFPRGVADLECRLEDKHCKNTLMAHAERNALDNCVDDPTGWTMYTTRFPCLSKGCSLGIIQRGIARVVSAPIPLDSSWTEDLFDSLALLREAGVVVDFIE